MECPKCSSENVKVELVQEIKLKKKRRGILYWVFIGFWWEPILWLFLTVPKLLYELFIPKGQKIKTKTQKMAVCQACGHSWKV